MEASSQRSLLSWPRRDGNPSDNNKVYQPSLLPSIAARFLPICLAIFFSQISIAQTSYSEAIEPSSTNSEISVVELRVPAKAWMHLQAADKALKKGSFDQAAKEVDRALQLDSACAPAFSMKAFVDMATKQPLAAIQHAERAIAIDPRGADSYVALAMADNAVENFAGGEIAARQAMSIRPNSWQARLELAKSLYGEGRLESALDEVNALDKDFPDIHLVKGNVLMRLGRAREGAAEFTLFLKEAPGDHRAPAIQQIIARAEGPL